MKADQVQPRPRHQRGVDFWRLDGLAYLAMLLLSLLLAWPVLRLMKLCGIAAGRVARAARQPGYGFAIASSSGAGQRTLVPLGQRSLTLYVGHGLLCVLLFGSVGLGWKASTVGLAIFALALWALGWTLARASGARRGPLEARLARR
jgi:uncharacterized membrane protein YeiB